MRGRERRRETERGEWEGEKVGGKERARGSGRERKWEREKQERK